VDSEIPGVEDLQPLSQNNEFRDEANRVRSSKGNLRRGSSTSSHGGKPKGPSMRMTPLPRVSRLAANPAPTITVHSFGGKSSRIIVQFQLCWGEFLDYCTEMLDDRLAVTHLYTVNDKEITATSQIVDGQSLYTATQKELETNANSFGATRATLASPKFLAPLVTPDKYSAVCKAAEKRARKVDPQKVTVRANHWNKAPPPGRFAKVLLVSGTLEQLLDEVTKKLNTPNSVQYLYHENDEEVTGVDDIKDGETLYIVRNSLVDSGRDWGKTLCPMKRKVVTVHMNHWSEAPPPSRYTQNVLVPDNLALLFMKITDKMKTNGPVLKAFTKKGALIHDVNEIEDEGHIYLTLPPDAMTLSKREWGKTLCPKKRRVIVVHANRDPNDTGCFIPIVARSEDEEVQMNIVLEEITRRLGLGMMVWKVYDVDSNLVNSMEDWQDGTHYYTHPKPEPAPVE